MSSYNPQESIKFNPNSKSAFNMGQRQAKISRKTNETKVEVEVDFSGTGIHNVATGIGFFDHMLEQLSRHSLLDLKVSAKGDLQVDQHHTVEDVGIVLGQAVKKALGEMRGITRFAEKHLAMDESLTRCVIDLSGRPYLIWQVEFPVAKIGDFDSQLIGEFFRAFAMNAGITLHVTNLYGSNSHHIAESCFKALAVCLRTAVELDPRQTDKIPSSKGQLGN